MTHNTVRESSRKRAQKAAEIVRDRFGKGRRPELTQLAPGARIPALKLYISEMQAVREDLVARFGADAKQAVASLNVEISSTVKALGKARLDVVAAGKV